VVDDAEQGITQVVRGADLLGSTARQIYLQRVLGLPEPEYLHVPVAADRDGQKLSKQTFAAPVEPQAAGESLWRAAEFLGQQPPTDLKIASPKHFWQWLGQSWRRDLVPPKLKISLY
jgi:glutamyl-Q tRNA(Asp) synthetase